MGHQNSVSDSISQKSLIMCRVRIFVPCMGGSILTIKFMMSPHFSCSSAMITFDDSNKRQAHGSEAYSSGTLFFKYLYTLNLLPHVLNSLYPDTMKTC
jgi:hypothetical protein